MTTLEGTAGSPGEQGAASSRPRLGPADTPAALASSRTHSYPEGGLARPRRRHPRWGPEVSQSAARTGTCSGLWSPPTQKRRRRRRRQPQTRAPEPQAGFQHGREGQSRALPGGQPGAPPGAEPTTGHTGGRTSRPQALKEAGWSCLGLGAGQ